MMQIFWRWILSDFSLLSLLVLMTAGHNNPLLAGNTEVDDSSKIVTIAVLGRSGSGVSSTVSELVGPNTTCNGPAHSTNLKEIIEYVIEVPSTNGSINKVRLLDIPGFVDGRTIEQDSQILASLKSVLQSGTTPDFYLAVSRFDDATYETSQSEFVQFLSRLELFHEVFLNKTESPKGSSSTRSKDLFLLTHFMSANRAERRRPQIKISKFVETIQENTAFPSPMSVIIGENKAGTKYWLEVKNGYYKLPNGQYYPKNIWEGFINLSSDQATTQILTRIIASREMALRCETKLISGEWEGYDGDAEAFEYLLREANTTVENTQVNSAIDEAFRRQTPEEKKQGIVQTIALQRRLQQQNLTESGHFPVDMTARTEFFQKNYHLSGKIPAHLLKAAFGLEMPEYIEPMTVGYGYLLMEADMTSRSPLKTEILKPSPLGYRFPNFMKCKKLIRPETEYFKSYSVNMAEFNREILKYLDFPGKETENNASSLQVALREGFNLQPDDSENNVTLTAVQEHRLFVCQLVRDPEQWVLDPEFVQELNGLSAFDKHNRSSAIHWKDWVSKWGSHIVVDGYGGGSIRGSVVSQKIILESQVKIDKTLSSIMEFTPFPVENLGAPEYKFYGGEIGTKSESLYTSESEERKGLVEKRKDSLNSGFIMLTNELELMPISELIRKKIGGEKGDILDNAIKLLLKGKLKYERKRTPYTRARQAGRRSNNRRSPLRNVSSTPAGENFDLDANQMLLQSQIDSHNQAISLLEQRIADRMGYDSRQHQKNLQDLERRKQERQRLIEQKQADRERLQQKAMERDKYYRDQLNRQQEYHNVPSSCGHIHLRRQMEEDQRHHEIQMAILKKQQEEEERRQAEEERCSGFDWLKCMLGRKGK